jgi:hypothetical protein
MFPTIAQSKKAIALLAAVATGTFGGLTGTRFGSSAVAQALPGPAQINIDIGPRPTPLPPPAPAQVLVERLSDQQLDHLLSPVALYPDPLLAALLPASTYPDDLARAADWLRYHPFDDAAIGGTHDRVHVLPFAGDFPGPRAGALEPRGHLLGASGAVRPSQGG